MLGLDQPPFEVRKIHFDFPKIRFHAWNCFHFSLELSLFLGFLWFLRLFSKFLSSANPSLASISMFFISLSNAVFFSLCLLPSFSFPFFFYCIIFFPWFYFLFLCLFLYFLAILRVFSYLSCFFSVFVFYSDSLRIPFSVAFLLPFLACLTFLLFSILIHFTFTFLLLSFFLFLFILVFFVPVYNSNSLHILFSVAFFLPFLACLFFLKFSICYYSVLIYLSFLFLWLSLFSFFLSFLSYCKLSVYFSDSLKLPFSVAFFLSFPACLAFFSCTWENFKKMLELPLLKILLTWDREMICFSPAKHLWGTSTHWVCQNISQYREMGYWTLLHDFYW